MANKKIIFSLFVFISINVYSQDSTNKNTGIIYKKWPYYRMDGKRIDLKTELYKVPAAIPYYQKANTSKIISYSFAVPAVLFVFLGNQNTTTSSNKNNIGYDIAGILIGSGAIFFICRYAKNLKKAIRLHNENIPVVY